MTNMEEMTPEEFDARLERTDPVEVVVNLRPKQAAFYRVTLDTSVGFSSMRPHTEIVSASATQTAAV